LGWPEGLEEHDAAMDLLPLQHPAGRQLIERYGPTGFRVAGVVYRGPLLVFPDRTLRWTADWTADGIAAVTWESLRPVIEHGGVQILLLGLGRGTGTLPGLLRAELRRAGIAVEPMDTGAACRTYNVLLAEDRQVAAALIPPA
jgi:uncharacterized protein